MALSENRPTGDNKNGPQPEPQQSWKLKKFWETKKTTTPASPQPVNSSTTPNSPRAGTSKTSDPPKISAPPKNRAPPKSDEKPQSFVYRPNGDERVVLKIRQYGAAEKGKSIMDTKKRDAKYELPFVLEAKRKGELAAAAKAAAEKQSTLAALKARILTRRRLSLDTEKHLYFLYDPGKPVSSAIKITNVSKGHVAFKFQTNAPKSCSMRPNSGVLAPKETLTATVVKFIEPAEGDQERKTKDKFKILSLPVAADKVDEVISYAAELFDYQKDMVAVESILQVVYLDPNKASPEQIKKLQTRLEEAEAADAARQKPDEESTVVPAVVADALVLDQWRKQREKFKRQQVEGG